MKILTLVRHAKSSWKEPGLSDRERPLNRRGKRDAPLMGKRLHDIGVRPSLICSSPAVRAWRTARAVATATSYPQEFLQKEPQLYLAGVDDILDVLISLDERFNSVVIVGHNPGFTDFANFLVPQLTNNLPTAGLVAVEVETDDWNLRDRPVCRLLAYDYPKKLAGSG